MTLDEFEKWIDAYGAKISSWPERVRGDAATFLDTDPAAQGLINEARALDGLLDQAPAGEVHASLVADILASTPSPQSSPASTQHTQGFIGRAESLIKILWPQSGWLRPAGLLTATMAFGFYMGFAGGDEINPFYEEESDTIATLFDLPEASDWDGLTWDEEGLQ